MLSIAGRVLHELGLTGSGAPLRYYINITTGDSLSIAAFVDDGRFFQLKVSEFVDLGKQYGAYCRAGSVYPHLVPRPHGCCSRDEWSIMVSEGVHHKAVRRDDVFRSRWQGRANLAGQLWAYFEANPRHDQISAANEGQSDLLSRLAAHFGASSLARIADNCIAKAKASGVGSMPKRPQHCDFVLNNIGRAGSRLVVFDWEDYEEISLPGLDLFTLCLTLLEGDIHAVHAMMRPKAHLDRAATAFLRRACKGQDIDLALFRRLVPFYLLVFLYLKRNYGTSVQDRIAALLLALSVP